MNTEADHERRLHSKTFVELVSARQAVDRLTVERTRLVHRISELEQECEANRDLMAVLAASVGGASL